MSQFNNHDEDAVKAYAENLGLDLEEFEDWEDEFEEAFCGQWDSDIDFVQDLAEDTGLIPSSVPSNWIDWDYVAQEIMYDYFEQDGYYFRNL